MSLQQIKKATEMLGKITKVDENTWVLPSKSDESKTHTVTYNEGIEVTGDYDCDCLGFQHTLNCYHVIAVKMSRGEKIEEA